MVFFVVKNKKTDQPEFIVPKSITIPCESVMQGNAFIGTHSISVFDKNNFQYSYFVNPKLERVRESKEVQASDYISHLDFD